MNLRSSIHDTPRDAIVETHRQSEIERSKAIQLYLLPEIDINIEINWAGFNYGVRGLDAQLLHFKDYWDDYALGYREYYCGLLGVKIPASQIPLERPTSLMTT